MEKNPDGTDWDSAEMNFVFQSVDKFGNRRFYCNGKSLPTSQLRDFGGKAMAFWGAPLLTKELLKAFIPLATFHIQGRCLGLWSEVVVEKRPGGQTHWLYCRDSDKPYWPTSEMELARIRFAGDFFWYRETQRGWQKMNTACVATCVDTRWMSLRR